MCAVFRSMQHDCSDQRERSISSVKVNHLPRVCPYKLVRNLFSKYGKIVGMKVNRGPSESYAYVNFSSLESARRAEADMNGRQVDGRALGVGINQPEMRFTLKIVSVQGGVDEEDLASLCKQFKSAEMKTNAGSQGNCAYLNFRDEQEARRAHAYLNSQYLHSKRMKVKWLNRPSSGQSGRAGEGASSSDFPPVTSPHLSQYSGPSPPKPTSSTVKLLIRDKGITSQNLQDILSQ